CHAEGTAVMIQLTHLGPRNSNFTADWLPLISAGRHREPTHRSFTKAMEDFDIERVVDDFAAARRGSGPPDSTVSSSSTPGTSSTTSSPPGSTTARTSTT